MKPEKEIEAFFEKLKIVDKDLSVPGFEKIVKPGKRQSISWRKLGIAASVLILVGIFTFRTNQRGTVDSHFTESLPLSLELESISTNSLINSESSIEEWSAPSNSLINNYHEW